MILPAHSEAMIRLVSGSVRQTAFGSDSYSAQFSRTRAINLWPLPGYLGHKYQPFRCL